MATAVCAAKVESKGAELEVTWLATEHLTLHGTAAYLDAEYDDYIDNPQFIGNKTRNAPEETYSAYGTYEWPLSGESRLAFRVEYSYKSRAYQDPANNGWASIPSFELWNARASYHLNNNWEFVLWGKNLDDEEYLAHNYPWVGTGDGPSISGMPRSYGASVTYRTE